MNEKNTIHIMPVRVYVNVFFLLLALTAATVLVSFIDLGPFNIVVALTIAAVKAYIVLLYFMHVKYSNKIIWLTAAAGFIWLMLMLALTLADFATRGWIPYPDAW
jgi:cytochrome c oxidase subunit IV